MNDRGRISNLEEMAAEVFIKLDRVENDLKNMRTGWGKLGDRTKSIEDVVLDLSNRQTMVDDSNTILKQSLLALTQIARKNSREIDSNARNTLNKDDLARLFEYMMLRFDGIEERFKRIEERIDRIEIDLKEVRQELNALK